MSYDTKVLNVGGTAAAEKIDLGQLGRKAIGVNLNAQADGSAQDADVTMAVPEASEAPFGSSPKTAPTPSAPSAAPPSPIRSPSRGW